MLRFLAALAAVVTCLAQGPQFTRESVLPAGGRRAEPLRPGMLVSIYGRGLAPVDGCGPEHKAVFRPPYPHELCRVTVTVAGKPAGLLAVMHNQINLQVPEGVPASGQAPIEVTVAGERGRPVMVDFGQPVVKLSLEAPAYVGLPVWIRLERPHPYDTYYPYSTDPRNFGGGEFEVKREGVPVKPRQWQRPVMGGVAGGLAGGTSAPAGSTRSRLPLHLAVDFDRPGRYAVRFTAFPQTDRSEWFEFDVLPFDRKRHEAWTLEMKAKLPRATAGELAGDILPSLLASPAEWMIPVLLDLTHWSDTLTPRSLPSVRHGEQIVQRYAAECLRAFDEQTVARHAAEYARRHGPPAALFHAMKDYRWVSEAAIRKGLASGEGWAQTGALRAINNMRIRTVDRAVLDSAPAILKTNDAEAVAALACVLPLIGGEEARGLLWRIIESGGPASGQALLSLTWMSDARDLPRLGALLLKADPADPYGYGKSALPYQLEKQYGERAHPYLRRALREAPQLWVRKEAALPLARRGEPAAFATLLDIIVKQPSAQPEILGFVRGLSPELKRMGDAEALAYLRKKAGR